MSITKSILAEQVKRLLGESEASRYDIREVMLAIGQARDYRIRMEYFESLASGEGRDIPHEYLSTYYKQQVSKDKDSGRICLDLPATYLQLPKGRGIFSVYPDGKELQPFIQSEAGVGALLKNHPVFKTACMPAYYPEGRQRIYFRKDILRTYPCLTVKLVRASEDFGEEEELAIPPHMQLVIVQEALNLLRGKPATDKVNDNTDIA